MSVTQPLAIEPKETKSLYELYNELFECIPADTEALIDECYKLRYHVYCLEQGYEEHNPDHGEYERDAYDGQSMHALLRSRKTGEYIGTVRLIMGDKESPKQLPAFDLCDEHHIKLPPQFYTKRCVEISRFCISKSFRRRATDSMYATSYTAREMAEMRARIIPFMALGMMAMVFKICADQGIDQATAVVEPSLLRLLDKLGIHFVPVGPTIEYHGTRQVTYVEEHALMSALKAERPDVYDLMVRLR